VIFESSGGHAIAIALFVAVAIAIVLFVAITIAIAIALFVPIAIALALFVAVAGKTVRDYCHLPMDSTSMCSNILYMSNVDAGSSLRWLSGSTMM
jgi:hypothetical protein